MTWLYWNGIILLISIGRLEFICKTYCSPIAYLVPFSFGLKNYMNRIYLAILAIALSCCQMEAKSTPEVCSAFPDSHLSVSIGQTKTLWPCFVDKTLVLQGYLAPLDNPGRHYYVYSDVQSARYSDPGNRIEIQPDGEIKKEIDSLLKVNSALRVRFLGKQKHPFVFDNIDNFTFDPQQTPINRPY